jgi:rhodanese-related sulfurtransferase
MSRFNTKLGAGVLVGAAALYAALSLATGRTAHAEVPPDLSAPAKDAALDVWKGAALVVQEGAFVADVRPADAYARYHLPGAKSMPAASAAGVRAAAAGLPVLVYAGKDEVAQKLVAELRGAGTRCWYLADGARAWYLAFQLPVPLFAESSPPDGYPEALHAAEGWFERPDPAKRARVAEALQVLAKANYQPTLLKSGKKAAAASGGKKKISGGCG